MRTPCLFHRTFPQRWKTLNGEGSPSIGSLEPETGGKAGWTIARGFSTPHVAAGVLTHFLLSRALSSDDDHPYTAWPPAVPDPASSKEPQAWPRASERTSRTTVIVRRCTASVIACGRGPAVPSSVRGAARDALG